MSSTAVRNTAGPTFALVLLGAAALAPVGESVTAQEDAAGRGAAATMNAWREDLVARWLRFTGGIDGDSYQLYATVGSADPETSQQYYSQRGIDELGRIFSR
jgi:hypothetical protein